jgi:hypothetical protein
MRKLILIKVTVLILNLFCSTSKNREAEQLDMTFLILDVNSRGKWQFWQVSIDGITYKNSLAHGKKSYIPIHVGHRKIHICLDALVSSKPFGGTYIKSVCKEELDNFLIFPSYGGYYKIEKQSVYIIKSIPLEDSYTWKNPTLSIETVLDTIFLPLWPISWFAGFSPQFTQLYAYELVPERVILGDDAKKNLDYLGIIEEDFLFHLKAKKKSFVEPRSIYYISDHKNILISKAIPILEFKKIELDEKMEPVVIGLEIISGETEIEKGSKVWALKQ